MAIKDAMNNLYTELTQRQRITQARALLQNVRSVVQEANSQIQEIADSGSFDTIDTEIKQALIAAWDVTKDTESNLNISNIKEILDWSP